MSLPPSEAMRVVADGILRWHGTQHLGATDVLIWWRKPGYIHVALRGPAARLAQRKQHPLNNRKGWLDLALQAAVGLPAQRANYGGPDMQTMEDGDPYIDSVLEGIETTVSAAVQQHGDPEPTLVFATLMPEEGSPWSPQNDPSPYYSARKKKVLSTRKPEWLVTVDADEQAQASGTKTTLGADVCQLMPRIERCGPTVVGMLPERKHFEFLVTHSLAPGARHGQDDLSHAASTIKSCGGLLLPSLAIGHVPATFFGTLVLVCAVNLPLLGLRPYRSRSNWPVTVYGTDAWTVVTRDVLSRGSRELFGELTGNRQIGYSDFFWVLGSPPATGAMTRPEDVVPLAGTKQLATKLLKRAKPWPRGLTQAQMQERKDRFAMKADYYPYVEAKVNGILPLSCFPLAVVPECRKQYLTFLRAAGFDGDVLTVDLPVAAADAIEERSSSNIRDELSWQYAWSVRDAVLHYAAQSPNMRIFAVEES